MGLHKRLSCLKRQAGLQATLKGKIRGLKYEYSNDNTQVHLRIHLRVCAMITDLRYECNNNYTRVRVCRCIRAKNAKGTGQAF